MGMGQNTLEGFKYNIRDLCLHYQGYFCSNGGIFYVFLKEVTLQFLLGFITFNQLSHIIIFADSVSFGV